jgi:hypothetical protein
VKVTFCRFKQVEGESVKRMRTNLPFGSSMMIHFENLVFVLFMSLSILLLNECFHHLLLFVDGFSSQQGMGHFPATLSQTRLSLAATSSDELVFFAGGLNLTTGQPSNQVDIYNVTNRSWTTATLSIPRGDLAATSLQ